MDEGGDGSSGVEIPENADYILFAEDLVNFVMNEHSDNYVSERSPIQFRALINNPFDENIQRSIQDLLIAGEAYIHVFFRKTNYYSVIKSPENYTSIVNDLEKDDLKYGFDGRDFISHCGNISILAVSFYNNGVLTAPKLAKSHIVKVLKKHMPAYGWHLVRRAAEIFPLDHDPESAESSDSD